MQQDTVVIIPARYASTRLPAKALKMIGGKTLIQWVWENAVNAKVGPVFIATDHQEIARCAQGFGADVVMTCSDCSTGTDRVAQAVSKLGQRYSRVVNVQGDLPFIHPKEINKVLLPLDAGFDVGTLVACMQPQQLQDPGSVKAIITSSENSQVQRCHWFCRAALSYGHFHLGVYAYAVDALAAFARSPQHPLEKVESLEQLRFLCAGKTIGATLISTLSLEVNTQEDLQRVRDEVALLHG